MANARSPETISAPENLVQWRDTIRLVPSRYPSAGILDRISEAEDLEAIIELEAWTNDRISNELGTLYRLPREEWVAGKRMASVVMAAYCHPRTGGARFTNSERGGWYAARTVETAHAEVIYHRGRELEEIGVSDTHVQVRTYLADFSGRFHDIREARAEYRPLLDPSGYAASQRFGQGLLEAGSHGIVYRSVRHEGGECLVCFRPKMVVNVRAGRYYEYRWQGSRSPTVRELKRS